MPLRMDARFSGFDTIAHVRRTHPGLADQAIAISHWEGYYSVNPILLGHLAGELAAPDSGAIRQLARSLRTETDAVEAHLATGSQPAQSLQRVLGLSVESLNALVSKTRADMATAGISRVQAVIASEPPLMDLPFPARLRWQFNGVHTFTGDDNGSPMSSLDFTSSWSQRWRDDTSGDIVTAAHDGEVTVFSDCFVQIQHANGWGTRYYHLDEVPVFTGQKVRAGHRIGIYAGLRPQALCSGGHSTGPHLHFSLLRDGRYTSIADLVLSGYRVHPGEESYDSSPERMWLEKRELRYFAYGSAVGQEPGDNTIDYRYNGMWYTPEHSGHGLNIELTELPAGDGTRKVVFVVLYTYDDGGEANFYVGNRDFDRWRSDESMTIELLQTAGGDLTNLSPIDFMNPDHVKPVGGVELLFRDCNTVSVKLQLQERTSGQPAYHLLELDRLIGVPPHVCMAASLPLP
jgi:hypothetical protein